MRIDTVDSPGCGRRFRVRRGGIPVAGLVGVALLAAACGAATNGPGVANIGSTTATTAAAPQGGITSASYSQAVAYAECMRSHGDLTFPDPNSEGLFLVKGHGNPFQRDPRYASANRTCDHLDPNGGRPTQAQRQQMLGQLLKYAGCVRTHGLPTFPDPVSTSHLLGFSLNGIDVNSAQFERAHRACRALLPGG